MLSKRQLGFIILIICVIAFITIPVAIIVMVNLKDSNSNPKWDYYVEPGIYTAQEEIHEGNIIYTLWTYIYRDFMPISPPGGKPLIAGIRVYANNVEDFPLTTKIERLWIIDGSKIKSTLATDEVSIDGSIYEMVFRDGPKWGPGFEIDVVVKLNSSLNIYYIKAINQYIHATF
ncbi:MAG: hypothetical protein ACFFCE_12465 [Promethearchaeota archaeon]